MNDKSEYLEVRLDQLSPQALQGVVEEFIMREGTDYGHNEYSLDEKIKIVIKQIKNKQAKIVFEPESETTSIIRS
jgi:uncharacterized protein